MYRLYKMKNNAEYLLYESEVQSGTDPRFRRVALNEKKLCNNDENQEVFLRVYNYSNFGAPKFVAETPFTVNQLRQGRTNFQVSKEHRSKGSASFQNLKMYTKH